MLTVNEVSQKTGVSIRALQYYDRIGLLHPAAYSDAGYRLYDDTSLEKLQQILLFRELGFPLKEIKEIVNRPDYDKSKALAQQIELLKLKKEHIENLIDLAIGIKAMGVKQLTFDAFDTRKIDEYARQAKASWGKTPEYKEYQEKSKGRTKEEELALHERMMDIFVLVQKLRDFITEHMYTCSKEILSSLGKMYGGGGDFTTNIDKFAGEGTAEFVAAAIETYCGK